MFLPTFFSPASCTLLYSKFTGFPVQITSMCNMSYLYFNTSNLYIEYITEWHVILNEHKPWMTIEFQCRTEKSIAFPK